MSTRSSYRSTPEIEAPGGGGAFVARPPAALAVGAGCIAVVVLAGLLIPSGPLGVDSSWAEWMRGHQTEALHRLALVFNALGRGVGRALSLAAIAGVLAWATRWRALVAFAAAEALTPIASNLTKHLVDRPRPPHELLQVTGTSFPSGHAAYAGATTAALVMLFTRPGPRRPLWWALAALGTAGMAWSRTYLDVHWLSDVVAGALLGAGVALVTFAVAQLAAARR